MTTCAICGEHANEHGAIAGHQFTPPTVKDQLRVEFEQWAVPNGYSFGWSSYTGRYHSKSTETAWVVWQAARAETPTALPDSKYSKVLAAFMRGGEVDVRLYKNAMKAAIRKLNYQPAVETPGPVKERLTPIWANEIFDPASESVYRAAEVDAEIERLERELAATAADVIRAEGRLAHISTELRAAGNPLADIYFHDLPAVESPLRPLLDEARGYVESFASLTKHPTAGHDALDLVGRIRAALRAVEPTAVLPGCMMPDGAGACVDYKKRGICEHMPATPPSASREACPACAGTYREKFGYILHNPGCPLNQPSTAEPPPAATDDEQLLCDLYESICSEKPDNLRSSPAVARLVVRMDGILRPAEPPTALPPTHDDSVQFKGTLVRIVMEAEGCGPYCSRDFLRLALNSIVGMASRALGRSTSEEPPCFKHLNDGGVFYHCTCPKCRAVTPPPTAPTESPWDEESRAALDREIARRAETPSEGKA